MTNMTKPLMRAWAGFTDGKIDLEREPDAGRDGYCALYNTRKEAAKHYEDVRRVVIYEAPRKERERT